MYIPSFTNDVLFKFVFGSEQNTPLLMALLNSVLHFQGEDQIVQLSLSQNQLDRGELEDKGCILDIRAIDAKDRRFNVEVQVQSQRYFAKRITYYSAKHHAQQLQSGEGYNELSKTYAVCFCDFKLWSLDAHSDVHSRFCFYDKQHNIELNDTIELHFFELPKLGPQLTEDPEQLWLHLLKFGAKYQTIQDLPPQLAKERPIAMALEERNRALADELKRMEIISREKQERDEISRLYDAREEGRIEGRSEGRIEGRSEGRIEGRSEAQQQIALRLSQEGVDCETIFRVTGVRLA